jgi:acyl carrier protein
MNDILKQLNDIFIDVLDNGNIVLTQSTSAIDIDEWDSLNHINLAVAIEKHFKIRFTSQEIKSWTNVGQLIESINTKLPA